MKLQAGLESWAVSRNLMSRDGCACVHICRMCIRVCAYMYMHAHVCMYMHMCVHMHACVHACAHTKNIQKGYVAYWDV